MQVSYVRESIERNSEGTAPTAASNPLVTNAKEGSSISCSKDCCHKSSDHCYSHIWDIVTWPFRKIFVFVKSIFNALFSCKANEKNHQMSQNSCDSEVQEKKSSGEEGSDPDLVEVNNENDKEHGGIPMQTASGNKAKRNSL